MKRSRHPSSSSSDESDNESNSTCWSQHSTQPRRGTGQKPSEVFRTDLITAMKVHDSHPLSPEDFYVLADPWRQEWEKGVQVPVSPQSIPQPVARVLAEKGKEVMFVRPKKLIRTSGAEALGYVDIRTLAEGMCRYDLNQEDVSWLHIVNQEFADMALPPLDEITMERAMEEFERRCHDNMTHATETGEGLGIEYDEDVVCDVCQSPDGEDNNEMVFCDKCNICVHQACYGIQKVPKGSWLCRICAIGILPKCQLCPKKGGAMKSTRSGTKWVHVSCALWIPEVSIGSPEKMEPITNVSQIPSNRWALICCLCKEKTGACIQCSAQNCRTAFHVTCGLQAKLQMKTLLTEDDEVKFKSFCPKHSGLDGAEARDAESGGEGGEERPEVAAPAAAVQQQQQAGTARSRRRGRVRGGQREPGAAPPPLSPPPPADDLGRQQRERVNLRKLRLQEMEEEFYQFVEAQEVAGALKLQPEAADFLFQYWKLKRKANFNQPLVTPRKDEEESLARREQEVLLRRLKLFTHLRQDLERVRNLTYMVTRREKMKRSAWRLQEQIFQHQLRLLDQRLLAGDPSAKDLEELSSLACASSPDPDSAPSWNHSGLRTKRGPLKQEGRKSSPDSPRTLRKEDPGKPPETKDSRSFRFKEAGPAQEAGDAHVQNSEARAKIQRSEVIQETVKLQKEQSRKCPRQDAAAPGRGRRDNDGVQGERRRRRRGQVGQGFSSQAANRFASKHLEKTVSIRLVDIRSSDAEEYFADEGVARRGPASSAATNKANGWLRKSQSGHLRGWGKFRIPKRGERPLALRQEAEPACPRPRLRPAPAKPGEAEPCSKRCHTHQLRGDSSLSRRYGSDIIRQGVLAS